MNLRRETVSLDGQSVLFSDGCLQMSVDLTGSGGADLPMTGQNGKRPTGLAESSESGGMASVIVGFRAEDVSVVRAAGGSDYQALADVISVDHLGDSVLVHSQLRAASDGSLGVGGRFFRLTIWTI